MRRFALILPLATILAGPAFADGRTIQIEPRPTYGATVSIEAGVRVFRPLPAGPRTVIVNPSKTPLVIDVGQTNVDNRTTSNSNVVINRHRY
ncbi:MAG: hypothetical protein Q7T86_05890 [Hyphomicrobiaceae bacterium]|jgi:hypothetical protein|nr:hypothetical protein [Hyphomicrobiaceae bacterium]